MEHIRRAFVITLCIGFLASYASGQKEVSAPGPELDSQFSHEILATGGAVCIWDYVSISCRFAPDRSWRRLTLPQEVSQGDDHYPIHGVAVGADQSVELAAIQKLFRSQDRGVSWQQLVPSPQGRKAVPNDSTILPFYADTQQVWVGGFQLDAEPKHGEIADIDEESGKKKIPILGRLTLVSLDWLPVKLPEITGALRHLEVKGQTILFGTSWDTFVSRDLGKSWNPVRVHSMSSHLVNGPRKVPFKYREGGPEPSIFCLDADHCWVEDLTGTILMSSNVGTWQVMSRESHLRKMAFLDPTHGFGIDTTNGWKLVQTADAGKTWSTVPGKDHTEDLAASEGTLYVLRGNSVIEIRH
jgi:hypothetical protein